VEDAKPAPCDDCAVDVTPYDEDQRPTEGAWEWYMVRDETWQAASRAGDPPRILYIGCLEHRLGRRLEPEDFADLPLNEPNGLESARLRDRLVSGAGEMARVAQVKWHSSTTGKTMA
jgi:hypothetical protein